jgi:organic anion transporter 3A
MSGMSSQYTDLYSISTSASAYTVDSRCEFLQRNNEEGQHTSLRQSSLEPGDDRELKECGILNCRPQCCQPWANIKFFIFVLCSLSTVSGTLVAGYVNSVITTIEKRFEIGSSYSGLIAASVEIGCLVAVIFVSYLGGRRHIPKWIGVGTLVQATGALLFSLPHVLADSYTISGGLNSNNTKDNICKVSQSGQTEPCVGKASGNFGYVTILVLAQILMGSGVTPLYTLGTTYIDDHVTKEEAPVYIAFIYATGALGPVLGFALGALMLQFYVDAFKFDWSVLKLTTLDSRWVGMWWGGFLICGVLLLLVSIPFFAFPKSLTREKEKLALAKQANLEDLLDDDQRYD